MSDDEKSKPVTIKLADLAAGNDIHRNLARDAASGEMNAIHKRLNNPMADLHKVIEDQQNLLKSLRSPYDDLKKTIDGITSPLHDIHLKATNSMLHQPEVKSIEVPRLPPMPKNPILETNKRLGQLETHFTQMLEVMTNAAEIGTAIQSHANEFLGKFEKASEDTDKSARKAVRIGVIAIFIAILTPFLQMAYDAYQDHTEAKLDRLANELVKLRETDAEANQRLIEGLRSGDAEASDRLISQLRADSEANREILREIQKSLSSLRTDTPAK
ncbi:hypothetical protein B5K11_10520 [Rhizobium leguminosarum bv. trifolii]|uniref:hypothetical protein n=1 Tax=Rhizobium leguminosarum TaxID=384 RepID=UPI000E38CB9A|nr:hypothetical protein [Rhizobium leguminosarum]RFB95358.1 hypothetical protein B5K11_10520 [Rhizobium leguminosarum bv. trifolii]